MIGKTIADLTPGDHAELTRVVEDGDIAAFVDAVGDYNPVHIDPEVAARAGFAKPILHGLCTFGIACFGLVQQLCAGDPARLKEIFVRFSRPVYPGDTIRLELFEEQGSWRFRARTKERDEVVLDRGLVRVK